MMAKLPDVDYVHAMLGSGVDLKKNSHDREYDVHNDEQQQIVFVQLQVSLDDF